jgi:hypothetical protein
MLDRLLDDQFPNFIYEFLLRAGKGENNIFLEVEKINLPYK